jgi:signal transduction histidine kinase
MFHSARLKLTAWYLLIIMVISIFFSVVIYETTTTEMEQGLHRVESKYEHLSQFDPGVPRPPILEPGYIDDAKERVRDSLFIINLIIFVLSSGAGYFLAGRTLRPIKQMVDEQYRFITDASHELHTPLTAAKTTIEVGLRDKNLTLHEARDLLKSNLEDINTMDELTSSLLFLAQFQNSKNIAFTNVQLKEIVKDAVKRVQPIAKLQEITIINDTTDYPLYGDKNSLIKVLVILLDNAIKYSYSKSRITIDARKTDGMVAIKVGDQGRGIDPKDIQHVFNRFYRTDKSRSKTTISGYGLGLSIAKKIITEHKGTITVKSIVDKGSTFTIQIPYNKLDSR